MKKNKICHITTAHSSHDTRILKKECTSLARNGYMVTLIAVNCEEEVINGVSIISVDIELSNRFDRFLKVAKAIYKKALAVDADIYHFHDPDFIFYGLKLLKRDKNVIYDVHEDYPLNILGKHWIPKLFRPMFSVVYKNVERYAIKKYSAIISVTPQIVDRLRETNSRTYLITNYPIIEKDFEDFSIDLDSKTFAFAGVIEPLRMIHEVVGAMDSITNEASFILAGDVTDDYLDKLKKLSSWKKVDFKGRVPFEEVISIYKNCLFGIVIEDYNPINYGKEGSLGVTKLFEYMMLGLPFIATDFILHKEIIDKYQCAITVNPRNQNEIIDALNYMYNNPEEIRKMGQRGKKAAQGKFNWKTQETELLKIYASI